MIKEARKQLAEAIAKRKELPAVNKKRKKLLSKLPDPERSQELAALSAKHGAVCRQADFTVASWRRTVLFVGLYGVLAETAIAEKIQKISDVRKACKDKVSERIKEGVSQEETVKLNVWLGRKCSRLVNELRALEAVELNIAYLRESENYVLTVKWDSGWSREQLLEEAFARKKVRSDSRTVKKKNINNAHILNMLRHDYTSYDAFSDASIEANEQAWLEFTERAVKDFPFLLEETCRQKERRKNQNMQRLLFTKLRKEPGFPLSFVSEKENKVTEVNYGEGTFVAKTVSFSDSKVTVRWSLGNNVQRVTVSRV